MHQIHAFLQGWLEPAGSVSVKVAELPQELDQVLGANLQWKTLILGRVS